ncbi:endo alpha-1,4 polygalactosaminidase [Nannocystis punicea]|uniref:Endo alpha-1,4 polygalactosaminidase n=1 Tax=Nannocystis punicea TaxID=2995304 RepID=A0ABY7GU48_9BACT|nr:endo alpha-1,4 polygalactosaminidase [Nannocystis poenicansa]WAS90482.1 endo alpha-1,4 polygalactosaminidase [Nannocystis poenicansa]
MFALVGAGLAGMMGAMNRRHALLILTLGACGSSGSQPGDTDTGSETGTPAGVLLPPANVAFDYQLGGAYPLPAGVGVVSRDRNDPPAASAYNICYVNGFQIQPDEESFWQGEHPDLVLRDDQGMPVIDADWDEMLIDVGSDEKRAAVAAIVGDWIAGCATDGYDAIEIDNLDSYSRSGGRLDEDDAVLAMRLFADAAHAAGLAIAQKNSAELVGRRSEMGTDFVVAEECNRYSECDVYTDAYGDHVLVIEYRMNDFDAGCADFPGLSIVLRDLELVTPDDGAYVYDGC